MIYVIATLTVGPGGVEALIEPATACIEATRQEEGCISYDLFASATEADTMVFVERWSSREALTAHSKTPHLAAWREASAPYLISRQIEIVHPAQVESF